MYAMFIFSLYAIPSLLLIGAILYDYRLFDASGISFILIGYLSAYAVLPIAGIIGIVIGTIIMGINIFGSSLTNHGRTINLKGVIKR